MNHLAAYVLGFALSAACAAALADVVVVVSSRSPLTGVSKAHLVDVFLGRASRFADGSPAVPIDQVEGSPVRDEFYDTFAGKSSAQLKAHWSKIIFTGRGQPPKEVADSAAMKKLLAENPHAIGYIAPAQVDASVRVLRLQ